MNKKREPQESWFTLRCRPTDRRRIESVAAEWGMTRNEFVVAAAKVMVVLALGKEGEEVIAKAMADRLGLLARGIDRGVGMLKKSSA